MEHLQPLFERAREDTKERRYESFAVSAAINLWEKLLKDRSQDYLRTRSAAASLADPTDMDTLADYFSACTRGDACELVEYVGRILDAQDFQKFSEECNVLLNQHHSGFRFINMKLVRITSESAKSQQV